MKNELSELRLSLLFELTSMFPPNRLGGTVDAPLVPFGAPVR